MNIYLARHGQNEDNANGILNGHRNLPLTVQGRQQADFIASEIRDAKLKFDKILCSPLIRALETAKIIATKSKNPQPIIEKLLIERDFGALTGMEQTRIRELCAPEIIETDTITYFLSPEGAETFPDLIDRANKLISKVEAEYSNLSNILMVGHGDMGKMIYAAYYNLPWEKVLTQFHFGNSEVLLLSRDSSADEAHVFKVEQYNH